MGGRVATSKIGSGILRAALSLTAVVSLLLVPVGAKASETASPAPAQTLSVTSAPQQSLVPLEARLLELMNRARVEQGLAALELDAQLVEMARERSKDMAARNYFAHTTPEGDLVFNMMDRRGILYQLAGENLARNNYPQDQSAEVAHQGFMKSPTHAENVMDKLFNKVGIGVSVAPNGLVYFTQLFVAGM